MGQAFAMRSATTIKDSIDLAERLKEGELVYDRETKMCYCMSHIGKFSIVIEEELAPCLGSVCPKRKHCYKYFLAQKFDENKFILRDLSTEVESVYDEYENFCGRHICCSKENRYKRFRWED